MICIGCQYFASECHFCLPVKAMYNCTCGFGQLLSILLPFLVAASAKSPSKVYGDFVNSFPCCLPFIYGCHYSVLLVEAKYMWIWPNLCHSWLPLGYLVLLVEAKYNGQRGCGDFWLHNQQLPIIPKLTFCVHHFCCALFRKINIIWSITSGSLHRTNYSFQLLQLTLCMALMGDTYKCTSTAC